MVTRVDSSGKVPEPLTEWSPSEHLTCDQQASTFRLFPGLGTEIDLGGGASV